MVEVIRLTTVHITSFRAVERRIDLEINSLGRELDIGSRWI